MKIGTVLAAMLAVIMLAGCAGMTTRSCPSERIAADKPLFRDPIYDGAADPVVIWNPAVERWWMFYTNRRANRPELSGVSWVHGTPIGIAESSDGGASWKYLGDARIDVPESLASAETTWWAPEVMTGPDGIHHMFLTVVPGVFKDWRHPRYIVHLKSSDLLHWGEAKKIELASDKVIDACVAQMPSGMWRMWYNNEADHKSIYYAESPDLETWTDKGKAVGDQAGEGPNVFEWRGAWWMITDVWHGLAVYRSDDAVNWKRQPGGNLLEAPGKGLDDGVMANHADVYVSGERAYVFYFTHPGRTLEAANFDGVQQRRTAIQSAELIETDGVLGCDRDAPLYLELMP